MASQNGFGLSEFDSTAHHHQLWEQYFQPLTDKWIKRLNLEHWAIDWAITDGSPNEDVDTLGLCEADYTHGYKARVTLAATLANVDEDQREWYIVHELVHLLFLEMASYVEHELVKDDWWVRLLEHTVSKVATALVQGERQCPL